jgi:hypothetical protein
MAETPRYAHLVALLFLGSAFVIFICVLVAAAAMISKSARIRKFAAAGAALTGIGYLALLFVVALLSRDTTVPPGKSKYFCEADCHIAYSIESVTEASTLGPETKPVTAQGRFVIVRLKTWFDEHSIAPFRGNFPLTPNPRVVRLVDDRGRYYLARPQIAAELRVTSAPLSQPLRPGESYATTFVFDLPANARNPRLLIADLDPVSRLLIDHENSLLHGKIYLSLGAKPSANASTMH